MHRIDHSTLCLAHLNEGTVGSAEAIVGSGLVGHEILVVVDTLEGHVANSLGTGLCCGHADGLGGIVILGHEDVWRVGLWCLYLGEDHLIA